MGTMASSVPTNTLNTLTGQSFFPNAIASPLMSALTTAFIIGALLCFAAAICSALRGETTTIVKSAPVKEKQKANAT
jgi:hypothetical protein